MKRQNIVAVVIKSHTVYNENGVALYEAPQKLECWGNLKKACIAHGWAYNTLSKRKLPVEYEGYRIERVPFL